MGKRKGDQHTGGGGFRRGGGKSRRPEGGWEAGDVARRVDTEHDEGEPKSRPGRKSTDQKSARARRRSARK